MASAGMLIDRGTVFLLCRYPFINAVTLLMLLGERAKRESYPPVEPRLIYIHVGLYVICGFFMSLRWKRKEATVVYAGQLAFFAYNMYTNSSLKYKEWMRVRMATRHVGTIGMCLLFAHLNDPKRQGFLRKLGEGLVGIYLFCCAYRLNSTTEDKKAFLWHVPGGDWSRYAITIMYLTSSLCFMSGYFLRDIALCMVITTAFMTSFVESDISYWTVRLHMDYWNQVRLIADNILILTGFIMIFRKFGNRVMKSD